MERVELKTAYCWHCNNCGLTNFAMPIKAELPEETREGLYRQFHDMEDWEGLPDDWQDFEFVHIPKQVRCPACDAAYLTMDERDG